MEEIRVIVERHETLLKLYTDQTELIKNKLDVLMSAIESLKPSREDWELERRVYDNEEKIKSIIKYRNLAFSAIIFLSLWVLMPDVAHKVMELGFLSLGVSHE